MAYTNPWDETAPLGTAAANTLDDIVRQLKLDLRERMDTILAAGGKFSDDPIILVPAKRTGQVLSIHPASAVSEFGDEPAQYGNGHQVLTSSTQPTHLLFVPLPLLDYWKVTKVEVLLSRGANVNATVEFARASFDTANTKTVIGTLTHTATGIAIGVVFTGSETITSGFTYWINIESSASNPMTFAGARITYDEV